MSTPVAGQGDGMGVLSLRAEWEGGEEPGDAGVERRVDIHLDEGTKDPGQQPHEYETVTITAC